MELFTSILISGVLGLILLNREVQSSLVLKVLTILIYIFLIYSFTSVDLNTYRDQLLSDTFYEFEIGYSFVQRLSVLISNDPKVSLWVIQIVYLILLIYLSFIMPNGVNNIVYFIPFIFVGEFNSLRQGFSIIILMIGYNSKNLKYILYALSPLFHLTAVFGVMLILLNRFKISYFFSAVIIIILYYIFLNYGEILIALVNYDGYLREEDFEGRQGPMVKFIFILSLALIYSAYLVKNDQKFDVLNILMYLFAFAIATIPAVDALFRLSYFLQAVLVLKYANNPSNKYLKIIIYLILLNPAIMALLAGGDFFT